MSPEKPKTPPEKVVTFDNVYEIIPGSVLMLRANFKKLSFHARLLRLTRFFLRNINSVHHFHVSGWTVFPSINKLKSLMRLSVRERVAS